MSVLVCGLAMTNTEPPRPPSPPLGPPRGTNFSRRNARQPRPPCPASTWMSTSSTNTTNLVNGEFGKWLIAVADHQPITLPDSQIQSAGSAHPLAALLLEHPNLRPARLAFDNRDDLGVGDKRRAREHFAAVLFDEQHLAEGHFRAGFTGRPVERGEAAGLHPVLPPVRLNDCVHICTHP